MLSHVRVSYGLPVFESGTLNGFKGAVNCCGFIELVFPLSAAQVLVRLLRQF